MHRLFVYLAVCAGDFIYDAPLLSLTIHPVFWLLEQNIQAQRGNKRVDGIDAVCCFFRRAIKIGSSVFDLFYYTHPFAI
jgi:hypothetical protein